MKVKSIRHSNNLVRQVNVKIQKRDLLKVSAVVVLTEFVIGAVSATKKHLNK